MADESMGAEGGPVGRERAHVVLGGDLRAGRVLAAREPAEGEEVSGSRRARLGPAERAGAVRARRRPDGHATDDHCPGRVGVELRDRRPPRPEDADEPAIPKRRRRGPHRAAGARWGRGDDTQRLAGGDADGAEARVPGAALVLLVRIRYAAAMREEDARRQEGEGQDGRRDGDDRNLGVVPGIVRGGLGAIASGAVPGAEARRAARGRSVERRRTARGRGAGRCRERLCRR
mmetsp:Transcript_15354/g.36811  ORF Transcript_15354/g.36811 Transcript_15354/m.36811 type:complete len:232 (-) Transcript_15354:38-733(-)